MPEDLKPAPDLKDTKKALKKAGRELGKVGLKKSLPPVES